MTELTIDLTHAGQGVSSADLELAADRLDAAQPMFLHLHEDEQTARRIIDFADRTPDWVDDVVVLGIGGSALAGRALVGALGAGSPRKVHFVDTVDPVTVDRLAAQIDPAHTLYDVVSKTGTTLETTTLLAMVWDRLLRELGPHRARERVVVTTDATPNPLREFSRKEGLTAFDVPPALGGRFTVLTPVGLLPAALAGIDIMGLLSGARAMAARVAERDPARNPALASAGATVAAAQAGRPVLVLWSYADALFGAVEWARQLWAEGTAKSGRGVTTMAAHGAAGQHAELQAFADGPAVHQVRFFDVAEPDVDGVVPPGPSRPSSLAQLLSASRRATAEMLARRGCPSALVTIPRLDAHSLGELTLFWEAETVLAAWLFGVDPLGEPAVEEGKKLTSSYLDSRR